MFITMKPLKLCVLKYRGVETLFNLRRILWSITRVEFLFLVSSDMSSDLAELIVDKKKRVHLLWQDFTRLNKFNT